MSLQIAFARVIEVLEEAGLTDVSVFHIPYRPTTCVCPLDRWGYFGAAGYRDGKRVGSAGKYRNMNPSRSAMVRVMLLASAADGIPEHEDVQELSQPSRSL